MCFSIKKPKEDAPKEIKNALPIEESDEEETAKLEAASTAASPPSSTPKEPEAVLSEVSNESSQTKNGPIFDGDDPILEMIDLTDDSEERKDAKRGTIWFKNLQFAYK